MQRFLTHILFLSFVTLCIFPLKSGAQGKPTYVDCTWWVHKPVLKTDSATVIKKNVKRIDLYELTVNAEGDGYDTAHYGRWEIKMRNGQIIQSDWFGSVNDCFRMDQVIFGEDMVVEQRDCKPNTDECNLKIISLIDKNKKQVTETQNKTMSEDSYLFYKIKYEYKNDLPASAIYYTDKKDDSLYKKIVFKYS